MNRSLLIDSLKVLLSQLIVLHHFSLYSPMADVIATAWPALVDWLVGQGPLAVQAFLVVGGFLSAQTLQRRAVAPVSLVLQRYLRLAPPLVLALLLVMGATLLAGSALEGAEWLSPLPSLGVFLAHVFLLQDVLGIASLSAGAWYVAIDLQLFSLLVLLAWLCRRAGCELSATAAPAWVALATGAAALVFSHRKELDIWAIYFLPAYGLGVLTAWAAAHPAARRWWLLGLTLVMLDLLLNPRERPLWTLATAAALYGSTCLPSAAERGGWLRRTAERLADLSYPMFVCHFSAIILASGLWNAWPLQGVGLAWGLIGGGCLLTLALAWAVDWVCARAIAPVRHRLMSA
jgi:peptidoglycan/LPS O-acetylase OafA/YrhL